MYSTGHFPPKSVFFIDGLIFKFIGCENIKCHELHIKNIVIYMVIRALCCTASYWYISL